MTDVNNRALSGLMQIPLSRRDLLLLGSAGLLSATLMNPAAVDRITDQGSLIHHGKHIVGSLAIGYWPHGASDSTPPVATDTVLDAAGLRTGETRFTQDGARLRILGLYPRNDPSALGDLESFAVDIAYEPYHTNSFRAWSFTNGSTPRASSPIGLRLPVDAATGLKLSITYKTAAMSVPTSALARFAVDGEANVPKLRQGVYVIGLPASDGTLPDWQAYRMLDDQGSAGCGVGALYCYEKANLSPAQHPHLVLAVE